MRATFKLLNSYFWKTIYGPIMSFAFPIILLAILGNIFRIEYVYPGIIALSFMFIGLLSLPLTIMEMKQSSLFKYIGSSPVNPVKFTIVLILFYAFLAIITAFLILIFTMIIFRTQVFPHEGFRFGILGGIFGSVKGAASFYIATGVHLLFVIVSGLLISTISKTPQQSLTIGLIIIIPSMFLSGMILSVDIIGMSPVLNWVSRMIPYRYSTGNIVIASTPLTQIGDLFQQLDHDQLSIIFKTVNPDNTVTLTDAVNVKTYTIHNISDLMEARKNMGESIFDSHSGNVADRTLFTLTFDKVMEMNAAESDNNIFHWTDAWAARRIPEVDSIKKFIMEYFKGFSNGAGNNINGIADQIMAGKFGWLEIFMKQTNSMYFKADRVLNLMLPLTASAGALWYVSTNFKWSNR